MIHPNFMLLLLAALHVTALGPQPPKVRPSGLPTYKPQGKTLNGTDFSNWVARMSMAKAKTVALAQGQYNVQDPNNDYSSYITFVALSGITVWMDKVSLVFQDNTISAFNIDRCSNLTTYGPTIWWSTPGFGQATITQSSYVGDSTYKIQFQCDAGYDCSSMVQNGALGAEYVDPHTGYLQPGPGWSSFVGPVTAFDNQTWQYTYSGAYFAPLVGHKLLSRGTFLFCNEVQSSNYTSINDFTTFNCGGFNWFLTANIYTMLNSVALKPAPFPPPGGTALPVRACSADGLHSALDIVGPQIDSCLFHLLDDDCIAIHGDLGYTFSSSGNTFQANKGVNNGDVLNFYTPVNYNLLGTAKVSKSTQANNGNIAITVNTLPKGFSAGKTVFTNQNQQGSGFSITNTHMKGNRGRGAIVKASNGLIANNVIEKISYDGLYLGPEFSSWNETDYVHNITIQNNQIRDCGYINLSGSAFSIHGDSASVGSTNNNLNPIAGNSNIKISNLLISGTATPSNMYIGATSNISLSNVVIRDALRTNYTVDEITPNALVNLQNVKFSGPVGICQNNTGSQTSSSGSHVADIYNYGTVIGGITTIPHC